MRSSHDLRTIRRCRMFLALRALARSSHRVVPHRVEAVRDREGRSAAGDVRTSSRGRPADTRLVCLHDRVRIVAQVRGRFGVAAGQGGGHDLEPLPTRHARYLDHLGRMLLFLRYRADNRTDGDAAAALDAASRGTVALLSCTPETLDHDLEAVKSMLTGDFLAYSRVFGADTDGISWSGARPPRGVPGRAVCPRASPEPGPLESCVPPRSDPEEDAAGQASPPATDRCRRAGPARSAQ